MLKVLKKVETGNPLGNFHLWDDLEAYNNCNSDEELADLYHSMLDRYSHRPLVVSFLFAMMGYSIGVNLSKKFKTV